MKVLFASLLVLITALSCSRGSDTPVAGGFPADSLLSRDRMVQLMTDVEIIEAALMVDRNGGKESFGKQNALFNLVFHKYRISRKCYQANVSHYQKDPEAFLKMYEEVVQRLAVRAGNYDPKVNSTTGVSSDRVD